MESILTSIKKLLGITEQYEQFDPDIIMHINTAFMTLNDIGVGPVETFSIRDKTDLWNDFIPDDTKKLEGVKTYIYLKVKMVFDPSGSATVNESLKRQADELEWRLANRM